MEQFYKHAETSNTPSSEPSQPISHDVRIDPTGDLVLVVGAAETSSTEFLVGRKAIQYASPAWDTMLDPSKPYTESSSAVVRLVDDDPDALLILLCIAHLQFKTLPKSLYLGALFELAVTWDEYDAVNLVKPFLTRWVKSLKPHELRGNQGEWLTIAYAFGLTDTFKRVVQDLVHTVTSEFDVREMTFQPLVILSTQFSFLDKS